MNDATTIEQPVRHKLQIHFDAHECEPTADELNQMADNFDTLALQVGNFPLADARVRIEWNGRNNEYTVKLTLILSGETLVTSDHDGLLHPAFERALRSLEHAVEGFKARLEQRPEQRKAAKGEDHEIAPAGPVDAAALDAAAAAGDYPAFRAAVAPYEDSVRLRAGRWIERYPEVQARIGKGMEIADVVEGTFLSAFEAHAHRAADVRYGTWLEDQLDRAVRAIAHNPEKELENISMTRSASGV